MNLRLCLFFLYFPFPLEACNHAMQIIEIAQSVLNESTLRHISRQRISLQPVAVLLDGVYSPHLHASSVLSLDLFHLGLLLFVDTRCKSGFDVVGVDQLPHLLHAFD